LHIGRALDKMRYKLTTPNRAIISWGIVAVGAPVLHER
jgi:hypothetical protein